MPKKTTTKEKVQVYETTAPLLNAMYGEIQELSKKKPEATLNSNKVKLINRLLADIKEMLSNEPDSKYLDMIHDQDLPQYSDVVLILSQYSTAMGQFKERYSWQDMIGGERRWSTE
jgi:hypothetical protein